MKALDLVFKNMPFICRFLCLFTFYQYEHNKSLFWIHNYDITSPLRSMPSTLITGRRPSNIIFFYSLFFIFHKILLKRTLSMDYHWCSYTCDGGFRTGREGIGPKGHEMGNPYGRTLFHLFVRPSVCLSVSSSIGHYIGGEAGRWTGRQTNRWMDGRTDGWTYGLPQGLI
jgi:hypothetical protein